MDKITEYKKLNAPENTVTRNVVELSAETGNIYETAVIVAQRANQITAELKEELSKKLETFIYYTDTPEKEVFENEEQITLSKAYEKVPKPVLLAMEEFVEGKLEYVEHLVDDAAGEHDEE